MRKASVAGSESSAVGSWGSPALGNHGRGSYLGSVTATLGVRLPWLERQRESSEGGERDEEPLLEAPPEGRMGFGSPRVAAR